MKYLPPFPPLRHCVRRRLADFSACAVISFATLFLNHQVFAQCPFNVSGASTATAANDGLLLVRVALGLRDSTLIAKVVTSATPEAIIAGMASTEPRIDVNGSGAFDETDAAIIVRYLMGFRNDALIHGGASAGALRKTGSEIQNFIDDQCVATALPTRKKLSVMKTEQMAQNNGGVFISVLDDVEIDQEGIDLAWLEIQGTLICADKNLSVSSRWIIVHGGKFQCGTALNPFNKNLTITLTGASSNDVALGAGMGTKVLGAMHIGAQLRLFGEDRKGWTQLGANAAVGATSITLKETIPTWRAGDKLVIAPSTFDAEDYDLVTITSISGSAVNFTPALTKPHWGTLQTYDGKTLDQRAAVGLLSRNIVIQGDAQSETAKFGGHIMSMVNANVQLSGVELRKMGQRGRFGRYPMHWHLANDRANDFVRNSSIHSSFQRAVVVHGTNNVTVEGNVAFDITNHAYVWAEDGNEVGNKFLRNLAVFNKNPTEAQFAFPSPNNNLHGNSTQSEFRSASFWGRNFSNTIIGNIAGGSIDGFGFFFDRFSPSTLGNTEGTGLVFEDNVAHSNYRPGASGVAGEIYPEATLGHGLMVTTSLNQSTDHLFKRFTSYKNYGGAWLEDRNTQLKDSILADNGVGTYILRGVIDNVSYVNKTANTLGNDELPPKGGFAAARRAAIVVPSSHGGARAPVIVDARAVGYTASDEFGYVIDQGDLAYSNRVDGLQMIPNGKPFGMHEDITIEYGFTDNGVNDAKGQLSGDGIATTWASRRSPIVSSSCRSDIVVYNFACPQSNLLMFRHLNAPRRFWLVEDSGEMHGVGQPWAFDANMSNENSAWIKSGTKYELVREQDPGANDVDLRIDPSLGRWVELVMRASAAPSKFTLNAANVSNAGSLATMRASSTTAYFYDGGTRKLHTKLVGASTTQAITINANWEITAAADTGRAPATVSALTAGTKLSYFNSVQSLRLRQTIPSGAPASTSSSNDTQMTYATTKPRIPAGLGGTTVFSGYLNAATSGAYKISPAGVAGNLDVYIGNVWVTGTYDNRPTVLGSPALNDGDYPETGKVWLKAGWHPITVVFARDPALYTSYSNFDPQFALSWAPFANSTRSYVNVFRTP
jgi:G8 domain